MLSTHGIRRYVEEITCELKLKLKTLNPRPRYATANDLCGPLESCDNYPLAAGSVKYSTGDFPKHVARLRSFDAKRPGSPLRFRRSPLRVRSAWRPNPESHYHYQHHAYQQFQQFQQFQQQQQQIYNHHDHYQYYYYQSPVRRVHLQVIVINTRQSPLVTITIITIITKVINTIITIIITIITTITRQSSLVTKAHLYSSATLSRSKTYYMCT